MSALTWDPVEPVTSEPVVALGPDSELPDRIAVGPKLGEVGGSITEKEIQLVQDLIETYLRKYVSQQEVAQALEQHEHVAPKLTELVWLKLEEENAKFFQAYYTRLKLKDQIVLFNHLLEQQIMALQRMPWMGPAGGVALAPRTGLPGPSLALHAGLPVPGMHLRQDGRATSGGGPTGGPEVALDADFAGLAELGLPGMSLPSPGAADGGAGLLSGPPHSLAFPSSAADVVGFPSISMSSPMRPSGFGGACDSSEIKHIPRNFSLSDLGPDMGLDHMEQLPPGADHLEQLPASSGAAPALPDGLEQPGSQLNGLSASGDPMGGGSGGGGDVACEPDMLMSGDTMLPDAAAVSADKAARF